MVDERVVSGRSGGGGVSPVCGSLGGSLVGIPLGGCLEMLPPAGSLLLVIAHVGRTMVYEPLAL